MSIYLFLLNIEINGGRTMFVSLLAIEFSSFVQTQIVEKCQLSSKRVPKRIHKHTYVYIFTHIVYCIYFYFVFFCTFLHFPFYFNSLRIFVVSGFKQYSTNVAKIHSMCIQANVSLSFPLPNAFIIVLLLLLRIHVSYYMYICMYPYVYFIFILIECANFNLKNFQEKNSHCPVTFIFTVCSFVYMCICTMYVCTNAVLMKR